VETAVETHSINRGTHEATKVIAQTNPLPEQADLQADRIRKEVRSAQARLIIA
jgi:hypothetical protein